MSASMATRPSSRPLGPDDTHAATAPEPRRRGAAMQIVTPPSDPPSTTIEELARLCIAIRQRKGAAPNTLVSIEEQWRLSIVPSLHGTDLRDLTVDQAKACADAWAAKRGPHAARKAIHEARFGWRHAIARGDLDRNPWAVVGIQVTRRPRVVMTERERDALMAYVEPIAFGRGVGCMGRHVALPLLFLLDAPTGRPNAVTRLQRAEVRLRQMAVRFIEHKTARTAGPKTRPVSEYQAEVLRAALALSVGSRWVFPSARNVEVNVSSKSVLKACNRASVMVCGRKLGPYTARRHQAQLAFAFRGAISDVQHALGQDSSSAAESYVRDNDIAGAHGLRLVYSGRSVGKVSK